jgi:phosphoglycolate phosphatase-like HAD superfamily hydrolase
VGDSVVDALAARQAGFAFAAVLTGTTPAEALQAYQLCTLLRGSSEIVTMIESV